MRELLHAAADHPAGLSDDGYAQLLGADGDDLEALCSLADATRADALGRAGAELTFVVNRNLTTAVVGAATPDADALRDALVDEAVSLGATELCVQGPLDDAVLDARPDGYLDLVRALARRAPELHLHAFRPAEVADAAARSGRTPRAWLAAARAAGLGSVPGTGARVLDDDLRPVLAPGGSDLSVAQWLELVTTAHEVGLRSTATIVYGHLETPAQQVAHLRLLRCTQDRTGGFTEVIAMPWTPALTAPLPDPLPPGGRRGPSVRETRALHAVVRLLLHGSIDHVQVAWTKLGGSAGGSGGLVEQVLRGGADDLGGLLLDGSLMPAAGAEGGLQLRPADVVDLAGRLGRTPRQRTTTYDDVTTPLPLP